MFKTISIKLLAFIFVAAFSSISLAVDFEGEIGIGALRVDTDHDSAKFKEYRGTGGDSTYLIGDIDLSYNKDAYYLDLIGKDLGLNTRNIRMDSGIYGRYKFFLEYDETPKFISENSRTIFSGAGDDTLTLPVGYDRITVSTTSPVATVDSIIAKIGGTGNLNNVDLELERKSAAAGFSMTSFKGLVDLNLSFKREEKEGIKSIGTVVQGSTEGAGGVRNTIVLPSA